MRMLNQITKPGAGRSVDLYPEQLQEQIDEINEWVYNDVNNGVYKCGFSTTQVCWSFLFGCTRMSTMECTRAGFRQRMFLVHGRETVFDNAGFLCMGETGFSTSQATCAWEREGMR